MRIGFVYPCGVRRIFVHFRPEKIEIEENNLGQILMADRVQNSPYEVCNQTSAEISSLVFCLIQSMTFLCRVV